MSTTAARSEVAVSPKPRLKFRKSAPVSPTVVANILMIQNAKVTSGTLFSMDRCCAGFIGGPSLSLSNCVQGSSKLHSDRKVGDVVAGVRPVRDEPVLVHVANVRTQMLAYGRCDCDQSEEHTSELQSPVHLVCRLLLVKKKKKIQNIKS